MVLEKEIAIVIAIVRKVFTVALIIVPGNGVLLTLGLMIVVQELNQLAVFWEIPKF